MSFLSDGVDGLVSIYMYMLNVQVCVSVCVLVPADSELFNL